MIRYAGVDLLSATEEVSDWIEANVPLWGALDFTEDPTWPGRHMTRLGIRPNIPTCPLKMERLYWPVGASRFSVGYYLVDQGILDAIRFVTNYRNEYKAAPLILDDGLSSLTTQMFMLPARPLQQIAGGGLYLLTLVDERYFWWYKQAFLPLSLGITTWTELYGSLATYLGITLVVDVIPATYLMPPWELRNEEPLPIVLDQVAACVGQRIVRQLDGTVRAWNVTASRDQARLSLAKVGLAVDKLAGGTFKVGR